MSRILSWFAIIVVALLLLVSFLLFTETGNQWAKPIIEQAVHPYFPDARVTTFQIKPDQSELSLQLTEHSQATVKAEHHWSEGRILGHWQVNIDDLGQLRNNQLPALSGPLQTEGDFSLTQAQQKWSGQLDLVKSSIKFEAEQAKDQPATLNLNGKVWLPELLTLIKQPGFIRGQLQLTGSLSLTDLDDIKTLSGNFHSQMSDGILEADIIKQYFDIALPENQSMQWQSDTQILDGRTLSQVQLNSPLVSIRLSDVNYTLLSDGIEGQHQLTIPNLNKLAFLTNTPMTGRFEEQGKFAYTIPTHYLQADANSAFLGGKVEAQLRGQDMALQLTDLQAEEVSRLMNMPEVFRSSITGQMNYQLNTQAGKFNINLYDGQILPNQFSQLLNAAARFDITREVYRQVHSQGMIDHGVITADIDMQGQLTHINSTNAVIDLPKQQVQAKLDVAIKDLKLPVSITGHLHHPDIKMDASQLIGKQAEQAAKDAVEKEKQKLSDQLKKQLPLPNLKF